MELIDLHTHSTFSHDGKAPLSEMVSAAKEIGLSYLGVSEHFDYDCEAENVLVYGKPLPLINENAYFAAARKLQAECAPLKLLVGCEFGYTDVPSCHEKIARTIEKYDPDFVINSVHTLDGEDCYFADYFAGREKEKAYSDYLKRVRNSLDAPYRYDIVGHIGYISRNAPYEDKKLRYIDFADILDEILERIIARNAILEVNTSSRGALSDFLPDTDILRRYFSFGGRAVSFASDAHEPSRLCEKYAGTVSALKAIGFTHWTVPYRGSRMIVPFD